MPHLEITDITLVPFNAVKLVPNKSFGQLFDVHLKKFIFLKTFKSWFSYIEVWFPDKKSKPLEM